MIGLGVTSQRLIVGAVDNLDTEDLGFGNASGPTVTVIPDGATDNSRYTEISHDGTDGVLASDTKVKITPELEVAGVSGDGANRIICLKADGAFGTCTAAEVATGTCTCT